MEELEQAMSGFLNQYNPEGTEERALLSGINAALRHNPTYSPDIPHLHKEEIRAFWINQLQVLGQKYQTQQTRQTFVEDVIRLRGVMNEHFFEDFQNGNTNYQQCFRIAHAQKSLSVYLKHKWCMGQVAELNVCPLDRTILHNACINGISWTRLDMELNQEGQLLYVDLLNQVELFANNDRPELTIAQWELVTF